MHNSSINQLGENQICNHNVDLTDAQYNTRLLDSNVGPHPYTASRLYSLLYGEVWPFVVCTCAMQHEYSAGVFMKGLHHRTT